MMTGSRICNVRTECVWTGKGEVKLMRTLTVHIPEYMEKLDFLRSLVPKAIFLASALWR
jgi:hypothetical protein